MSFCSDHVVAISSLSLVFDGGLLVVPSHCVSSFKKLQAGDVWFRDRLSQPHAWSNGTGNIMV